jgi:hypothetical protein
MRVSDDASAGLLLIRVQEDPLELRRQLGPAPSAMPKPFTTAPDEDQNLWGYFSTSP